MLSALLLRVLRRIWLLHYGLERAILAGALLLQPTARAAAAAGVEVAAVAHALRTPFALRAPPLRPRRPHLTCFCTLACFSALASLVRELLAPRGGSQLDVEQPPEPAAHVAVAEDPRQPVHLHRCGRALVGGSAHCGGKVAT